MIHPLRTWNRFCFGTTSARPLGVIRIGFGLLVLINLAFCTVDLDHWYAGTGFLQGDESQVLAGQFQHSPLHYLQSPLAIRVAFGFTALAAVGLTVGWRTKLMSILCYGGMLAIHHRNLVSSSGADVLLMVFAFNVMLSPCGAAYSVDAWLARRRRGGTAAEPLILLWPYRLFQFQSSLIYALAAMLKCGGSLWLNGTALHYVLNNSEVRRLDVTFLSQSPVLINLMTYSAVLFEFSLAFLIWFRAVRPAVIGIGILLHLGITITINIPIFGELMWLGYFAFLTPPEFNAFARAVNVRAWFRRAEPIAAPIPTMPKPVAEEPPHALPATVATPPAAASSPPARPLTVRIDGPAPAIPTPHRPEPGSATPPRQPTEREFAEAAMDPWDSFQILM